MGQSPIIRFIDNPKVARERRRLEFIVARRAYAWFRAGGSPIALMDAMYLKDPEEAERELREALEDYHQHLLGRRTLAGDN